MEYEEELVHNMLNAAQNAIVSMAKKVEDNILHVMIVLVFTPPSAMPKNPVANLLRALLRALNILVIK